MIDLVRNKTANPSSNRRSPGASVIRPQNFLSASKSVVIVVYDGVAPFELGVACDVFGSSSERAMTGVPWYQFSVCAVDSQIVSVDGGFKLKPTHGLSRIRHADTVVVPPTVCLDRVPTEVFKELQRAHSRGCRIISLCTGADVLAKAGLLDGRRATTHWSTCSDLARRYPSVIVDPGVLYVDGGDILTSAGSAASIDLCLHVVRMDYGAEVATRLAREMVVPPHRDGGQAQFIDDPLPAFEGSNLFLETLTWVQEHLNENLTVSDMATRSAMSPRTFARRFRAATGTTPHQWLQIQRVRFAQRLLEVSDLSIEAVATSGGFGTAANLRKHFGRAVRTSPQAYRRTFQGRRGECASSKTSTTNAG
jgi:AraC family transcriptional regulator, transcriptional activator FtrA